MNLFQLLQNPIFITILIFIIISYCLPKKSENFQNSSKVQAATALVQGGVTLHQAMKLGVSKQDYITATVLVANAHRH